jgi:hypothetical protein
MSNKSFYILIAVLFAASAVFWIYMFQSADEPASFEETQTFYELPSDTEFTGELYDGEITLTMYHGEGCMCCDRWADYLKEQGVTVKDKLLDDPHSIKEEYNIPPRLRSCHTAIVDGYVVEGHVPLEDIRRMLAEQPDATGISVPGMPPNAPGMDQPVDREYQVVLFNDNDLRVYATHN